VARFGLVAFVASAVMVSRPRVRRLHARLARWNTDAMFLEASAAELDSDEIEATLRGALVVAAVHDLRVWVLWSGHVALSAHVVVRSDLSLHEAQEQSTGLKSLLARHHAIRCATLELECHDCRTSAGGRLRLVPPDGDGQAR
jgi:cobalt-zinc-cadmium efflux system protein